ncbi:hypothetical protein BH23PAT1_BH23PAT1_0560 [soil metagenome]
MTDQIGDLLDLQRFAEPEEVKIIKSYLQKNFGATGQITVQQTQIIIKVPGAALAGALRMRLHELQELCGKDRRLVIRINSSRASKG